MVAWKMVGWENLDGYDKNQEDQSFPRKTRVYTSQCLQMTKKVIKNMIWKSIWSWTNLNFRGKTAL